MSPIPNPKCFLGKIKNRLGAHVSEVSIVAYRRNRVLVRTTSDLTGSFRGDFFPDRAPIDYIRFEHANYHTVVVPSLDSDDDHWFSPILYIVGERVPYAEAVRLLTGYKYVLNYLANVVQGSVVPPDSLDEPSSDILADFSSVVDNTREKLADLRNHVFPDAIGTDLGREISDLLEKCERLYTVSCRIPTGGDYLWF